MAITAAEVNKLRQMTGSGMMDCKNALVEAEGDFDKAIDILRKKGQKIAAKRADRTASDGYVYAQVSADKTFGTVVIVKQILLQKQKILSVLLNKSAISLLPTKYKICKNF